MLPFPTALVCQRRHCSVGHCPNVRAWPFVLLFVLLRQDFPRSIGNLQALVFQLEVLVTAIVLA